MRHWLRSFGERYRTGGLRKRCGDALVDGGLRRYVRGAPLAHFEREGVFALDEFAGDGGHGGRGAVLDREGEIAAFAGTAIAAQIEIGSAPGVKLGGAAQSLAGADAAGALLGMVDDDDGEAVLALQFAQIGEQRRDFA